MNARRRIERLEATQSNTAGQYETPLALEVYFKRVENERRKQAREPPIPLTPEEERWVRETENSPRHRAYWKTLAKQRKERLWREET